MKTAVYLLPFLVALCSCVELKFKTCILLKAEGKFTIVENATKRNITIDLETGSVDVSLSSCNVSSSQLIVDFQNGTSWTLLFTSTSQKTSNLDQLFKFSPATFFNGSADIIAYSDEGNTTLSSLDHSFVCNTPRRYIFDSVPEGDDKFGVELEISSIQVQAFNLNDSKFGPEEHCAADLPNDTTTAPTTTSTASTTTSTASTSTPTSTENPNLRTFSLIQGKTTCIKMTAIVSIDVKYETVNKTINTTTITIPDYFTVTGSCPLDSKAKLIVSYFQNDSLTVDFEDSNKQVEIKVITVEVLLDEQRFPDALSQNKTASLMTENLDFKLSMDDTYYECLTGDSRSLKEETGSTKASISLKDFKVQAFNLKDDFTGNGDRCPADLPSTSPAPTTAPPAPAASNYTLKQGNITCILLTALLRIVIPDLTNSSQTVNVTVPPADQITITGNCNHTALIQELELIFFGNWSLRFLFKRSAPTAELLADNEKFSYNISSLTLTYVPDYHFQNPISAEAQTVNFTLPNDAFAASSGGSYLCKSENTLKANNTIQLQMTDFQYTAFNDKSTVDFSNNVVECSQDTKDNSIVPIAVGAALAALVVIVLIAYLIGRRRSHKAGYESV